MGETSLAITFFCYDPYVRTWIFSVSSIILLQTDFSLEQLAYASLFVSASENYLRTRLKAHF